MLFLHGGAYRMANAISEPEWSHGRPEIGVTTSSDKTSALVAHAVPAAEMN